MMSLKACQLGMFAICFFAVTGCEGEKKESALDDLDRMAREKVQPLQHQNLAEKEAENTPEDPLR